MERSMNILLIEPRNRRTITGGSLTPPLWPAIFKALTPDRHRVEFIHCELEDLRYQQLGKYDLVGVSCRTDTATHAYDIGDACRRLSIPCVVGGIHVYFLADEAQEHFDAVVLGEAECLWPGILDDAAGGRLKERYQCRHDRKHDLPCPDRSVLHKYRHRFNVVHSIETVRGCPYACSFCCATKYNGNQFRYKPLRNVIKEIEGWDHRSSLSVFADLNVASNQEKAKDMLAAIAHFDLMWWGSADVKVADDDELLDLLAKSGCNYLAIGMESVSDVTLKEMNKAHNTKRDFKEVVKRLHDRNIDVFGNFIFGLDTDTPEVFRETVEFVVAAEIDFPVFQILVPYPGTQLHDELERDGRLLTSDWSKYTRSDVVFQPKNMTPDELLSGTFWAYEQAYSRANVARRAFARWRGVKRNVYNAKILSHFTSQIRSLERYHRVA